MAQRPQAPVYLTVDEFEKYDLPQEHPRAELIRGELRLIPPSGFRHGRIATRIAMRLAAFVESHGLGVVTVSSGYVLLDLPRTVRAPDVAFVATARVPADVDPSRIPRLRPDLAVEIVSPSETSARLDEKLDDYRVAEVPLVWVVDPDRNAITIIARGEPTCILAVSDMLDGGALLPGFSCTVAELLGLRG